MKQIVKLIDVDVDGCGTNVETMIEIEGKQELTNGIIQRTKDAIEKYKKENESGLKNLSVSAWSEQKEDVICILFFYDNEKFAKRAFNR